MEAKDLFTGERFVPGIEDHKLEIEHYQRYLSVQNLVNGKVVLDAACGEGYGSNIIASVAKQVIGLDIDGDTVERAKIKYASQKNLHFLQGSIESIPLENGSLDAVVSFETIEHVPEETQKRFLKEIVRVLKTDGVLIMSTPNKKIYSDLHNYKNEFHIKEFYHDEFLAFLQNEFQYVELFNQAFQITSMLTKCSEREEKIAFYTKEDGYNQNGKYYIAVASNFPIDASSFSSVYMEQSGEYEENIQRIIQLQNAEEERNNHIKKLDEENAKAGEMIRNLQAEENARNIHIQKLDAQIIEYAETIQERDNIIQEKNKEIGDCQQQLKELEQDMASLKSEREALAQTVRNKEGHIELLLEVERAYEREKGTHSYKFAKKIQKIGDFILPPESKRRFFLRIILNIFRHPILMMRMINSKRIKHFFKYLKLEGMSGVLKRYKEAEDQEKYQLNPLEYTDIKVEKIEEQSENIEDYDKLFLPKVKSPMVSIVIPVYNEFNYTYNCVKSIIDHSGDIPYEVLIANDCSTDITSQIEEIVSNVRLITMEKNGRFLLNCNNAAKYANGKYILFLNNDTQVQENWLEPLVTLIESDEKIGMVGSKLIYPDGTLQEAGGILWKDASAWNYGHTRNPEDSEFNYVKEVDYISGAAIMIKADLWKIIGGFDERFVPAYCEDSDLAFEVRKAGYKVMYQPLSVVVHFEGVSNGTDVSVGLKSYQVENSRKFYEKWHDVLEREHFPNAENVFVARDRRREQLVLLMVDHYVPHYDKDAGSRTVFQYLKLFVEKGFNVKFIGDNFYRHEPYTTTLQQMGIEVLYGPYYANNWQEWVKENADSFDFVFLNRPHISVKYIDFLRKNTRAKIIYYGHDLHFLREMRNYELTKDKKLLESSKDWKKKELDLMRKADVVYYPSCVEVEEISKIAPDVKAKAIVAYMFQNIEAQPYHFEDRKDLMFIGGFTHTPNEDAVLWFRQEVWPLVKKVIPDLKFYVLGSNPTAKVQELDCDDFIIKGFVTDEELERFYRECRMSVVPLRFGAGIKGKVVEAMRYGIPVITTSVGAEGIVGSENILCVEDAPEKLAERICQLYRDEKALSKMSEASYSYIRNHYSEDNAWSVIQTDFTK